MQTNSGRAVLLVCLKADPLDYKQELVGARTNFSLLLLLFVHLVVVVVVHCCKQEEASFLTAAWIHRSIDGCIHSIAIM